MFLYRARGIEEIEAEEEDDDLESGGDAEDVLEKESDENRKMRKNETGNCGDF